MQERLPLVWMKPINPDAAPHEPQVLTFEVTQPYNGRWVVTSTTGALLGEVNGDAVIGYTARDHNGNVVGARWIATSQEAINTLALP